MSVTGIPITPPTQTAVWTLTRQQLGAAVLRKIGELESNESADPGDLSIVNEALDAVLKEMHKLGVLWWQVSGATTDISLTADVATASVAGSNNMLYPMSIAVRIDGVDYPLAIITHNEYQAISEKGYSGDPEKAFFDGNTIYVWPVQNQARTAKLTFAEIVSDSADGTAPDVPTWALLALKKILAYEVADDFGVNEERIRRYAQEAALAQRDIRKMKNPKVTPKPVKATYY